MRLEILGNLIIFFTALFATIQRNYGDQIHLPINAGLMGLSISYALQVCPDYKGWVSLFSGKIKCGCGFADYKFPELFGASDQ